MATFNVTIAYDVPCYGTVQIEAKNEAAAVKKADRMLAQWKEGKGDFAHEPLEPMWDGADSERIVSIEVDREE